MRRKTTVHLLKSKINQTNRQSQCEKNGIAKIWKIGEEGKTYIDTVKMVISVKCTELFMLKNLLTNRKM